MKIALDIDQVLITYPEQEFLKHCERQGWKVDYAEFRRTHSFAAAVKGKGRAGAQHLDEAFFEFMSAKHHLQQPIPGAAEALTVLSESYELHAISGRGKILLNITTRTLVQLFPDSSFGSIQLGRLENKAALLKEQQHAAFIDDSLSEIKHAVDHGVNAAIIQFPSFRGGRQTTINHPSVHRLRACEHVHLAQTPEEKNELWQSAWQEITSILATETIAA